MYKIIILLALIGFLCVNYASAEPANLEVKILKGSSDQNQQVKSFYPEILPMTPGDTITWVNEDSEAHSITSGVPPHYDYAGRFFKTGSIDPSRSATVKIADLPDNFAYYYFCEIHPWLTGKIVVTTAPESQPETSNPVVTDKLGYSKGQTVSINGQVHADFANIPYQILIYENSDRLVDAITGKFDENAAYKQTLKTDDMTAARYTLKVVYGLPTQVGATTFTLYQTDIIPAWIKNEARLWADGLIPDSEFVDSIEHITKQDVSVVQKTQSLDHQVSIPSWFKTNASWWTDGLISDEDFARGLQYLAGSGIIQI